METLIPVNVLIGDRSYRIRIDPKDEETVRGTVKIINDKLLEFKTSFAGKDMQDYIAMVILWYATQQKSAQGLPDPDAEAEMKKIESLIDRAIAAKKNSSPTAETAGEEL